LLLSNKKGFQSCSCQQLLVLLMVLALLVEYKEKEAFGIGVVILLVPAQERKKVFGVGVGVFVGIKGNESFQSCFCWQRHCCSCQKNRTFRVVIVGSLPKGKLLVLSLHQHYGQHNRKKAFWHWCCHCLYKKERRLLALALALAFSSASEEMKAFGVVVGVGIIVVVKKGLSTLVLLAV